MPAAVTFAQVDSGEEIVFIDVEGFVRVLDTSQANGVPAVRFVSPERNWREFALGDVNADGDMEIIAIGGDLDSGKFAIYDPVVAVGPVEDNQRINGIPWAILYERTLPGKPIAVAVGEFNNARPGVEIIYGMEIAKDDTLEDPPEYQITILQGALDSNGGRAWESFLPARFYGNTWSFISTGNLDGAGVDEVILIDREDGILSVYRVDNGLDDLLDRIYNNESQGKRWRRAIPAHVSDDTGTSLVAIRGAPLGLPSALAMRYENAQFVDVWSEQFAPNPRVVFTADINGDGIDQIVMVREAPTTDPNRVRLFMRNLSSAVIPIFEDRLDADNGYQVGDGGDIDGDGKDEVAIMRDNKIRIYPNPEIGANVLEFGFLTNKESIEIGDLDANGHVHNAAFGATPSSLNVTLQQGDISQPFTVELINQTTIETIPFSYFVVGDPDWLSVRAIRTRTPSTLQFTFNATNLFRGTYRTTLVVTADTADVENSPYEVEIVLTVAEGIVADPIFEIVHLPVCDASSAVVARSIFLDAPAGWSYTAEVRPSPGVVGVVPWLQAATVTGPLPATLELSIDPAQLTADFDSAVIEVQRVGGSERRIVPVYVLCTDAQIFMPSVSFR